MHFVSLNKGVYIGRQFTHDKNVPSEECIRQGLRLQA